MKRVITLLAVICFAMNGFAQDTTSVPHDTPAKPEQEGDTIRVGDITIIKSGKHTKGYYDPFEKHYKRRNENINISWLLLDLGVNQVDDKTNYPQSIADGYLPQGANEDWFNQRGFKSTNVNIWAFMMRINMIKHKVNLKYGLGLELNNYKYTEPIRYQKTGNPMVVLESVDFSKNKLAADYVSLPIMLNFNFTPYEYMHGFGFSVGVSTAFLYSSRQKTVGGNAGKARTKDDFQLRTFKIAYIAEISMGPVILYGSYATQSMFENGLDHTPYSFGLRLSNWND